MRDKKFLMERIQIQNNWYLLQTSKSLAAGKHCYQQYKDTIKLCSETPKPAIVSEHITKLIQEHRLQKAKKKSPFSFTEDKILEKI